MNKEVLVALRDRVQQAPYLLACQYTNGDCFCAVGHVFVMGGATSDEIEVVADDQPADAIRYLVDESPDVQAWVEAAGLNPKFPSHVEFLKKLQYVNDDAATDESRKYEVLAFIDKQLEQL